METVHVILVASGPSAGLVSARLIKGTVGVSCPPGSLLAQKGDILFGLGDSGQW